MKVMILKNRVGRNAIYYPMCWSQLNHKINNPVNLFRRRRSNYSSIHLRMSLKTWNKIPPVKRILIQ